MPESPPPLGVVLWEDDDMAAEPETQGKEEFKSPLRKLATFFERSRNQWKLKFAKAKKDLKRLENRVRFLEQGKARWKEEAKRLKAEVANLKKKRPEQESEVQTDFVQKKELSNRL
jgi:hypothetical protein